MIHPFISEVQGRPLGTRPETNGLRRAQNRLSGELPQVIDRS